MPTSRVRLEQRPHAGPAALATTLALVGLGLSVVVADPIGRIVLPIASAAGLLTALAFGLLDTGWEIDESGLRTWWGIGAWTARSRRLILPKGKEVRLSQHPNGRDKPWRISLVDEQRAVFWRDVGDGAAAWAAARMLARTTGLPLVDSSVSPLLEVLSTEPDGSFAARARRDRPSYDAMRPRRIGPVGLAGVGGHLTGIAAIMVVGSGAIFSKSHGHTDFVYPIIAAFLVLCSLAAWVVAFDAWRTYDEVHIEGNELVVRHQGRLFASTLHLPVDALDDLRVRPRWIANPFSTRPSQAGWELAILGRAGGVILGGGTSEQDLQAIRSAILAAL